MKAEKQSVTVVGRTDDLRISAVRALIAPQLLLEEMRWTRRRSRP
jgi:hypothetical protein